MQDTFSTQPPEELPKAFSPSQENQPSQTNGEETHRSPTLSSREMPQWLLSELEAAKSQEIEDASTTPKGAERDVRQPHEGLADTGRQMAHLRHQTSSMQERQFIVRRERGGCLTTWLVFVGITNTLALIFWLVVTSILGPFSLLYAVTSAIVLIGIVGAWQLKKWGYYTLSELIELLLTVRYVVAFLCAWARLIPPKSDLETV
jgi:hypothetical protein